MQQLAEQYRPRTWSAVVGQDKAIKQLSLIRKRRGSLGGQAYFLSGSSGTGKTTLARLIAGEVADEWAIDEFDSSGLTAEVMARIEKDMQYRPLGRGRAWIINEVHGLRADQVRKLLSLIEPANGLPEWVVIVFTTTVDGQAKLFDDCADASPFLSRCAAISLARRDIAKPFAARLREIAQAEGLDGQPIERYVRLVNDNRANFRACLQAIEAGEMVE